MRKTLWDEIAAREGEARREILEAVAVFPEVEPRPSMSVRAPCCGRRTSADAVSDVRTVPLTIVRAGGHGPPKDHDWLCDACRTRMVRDPSSPWTASKLARATGAPADVIRDLRAREMVREEERRRVQEYRRLAAEGRLDEAKALLPIEPVKLREAALAELPEGVRELPGTDPPV